MRYLIVSQIYQPQKEGGAERVARRTAEFLRASGHDVHILSTRPATGPFSETDLDIPVHRLEYRNHFMPGIGPTHLPPLAKAIFHAENAIGGVSAKEAEHLLKEIKPDALYLHNSYFLQPQIGKVASKLGIPVILHIHDYSWMCANIGMYHNGQNCSPPCGKCRLLTSAWKNNINPVDIIAVSEFVRDRYKKHGVFPNANWHVLRNTEEDIGAAKTEKPQSDIFSIGFMGALVVNKGIELLIEAFLALEPGSARLVIAGSGEDDYVAMLKKRTEGRLVTWLGHVPKSELYDQVQTVVVPSLWHEPQALVVVEAIHRSLPLIVSRRGGSPEVVSQVGAGMIFDPETPENLVTSLIEMKSLMARPEGHGFRFASTDVLPNETEFGQAVESILSKAIETTR